MIQLSIDQMSKSFCKKMVLKKQSMAFEAGHIYGIVGENGCGKSVLFKCICGLIRPDTGHVQVLKDQTPVTCRPVFGAVIDGAGFIDALSGRQNLMMLANVTGKVDSEQVDSTMYRVGLEPSDRKKVRNYSLGMRQKLAIAQALLEDPPVLLLDEPLNGLDFESIKRIYNILEDQKKNGKIILVASHHEEDIRLLCDQVYWLKDGELCRIESVTVYTDHHLALIKHT